MSTATQVQPQETAGSKGVSDSTPHEAQPGMPTNKMAAGDKMKKKLVRAPPNTNQMKYKVWLAGHTTSLVFGTISLIFQVFWLPNKFYINSISYRLALLGGFIALTATFSHKFGLHFLPPIATLLSHQNFQYMILAIVWCFTFKSVFKIVPFFLISLLHLGSMKKVHAVEKRQDFLASLIAYDELALILILVLRTLFFRNSSGFQLVLFLIFYWLRILYNTETGNLFGAIVDRLDGEVMKIKNPKVQHYWSKTRQFVREKQWSERHE
ncbi:uncharacterized protein LODBEIA_P17570 [Lodderomyces beijingensis]|uniref:Uncharacterized protein n=1 Tax=Lodderomyces beijingensis TaxID=1775926 RepID=A0ABP0ZIS5_9ASCO